MNATSPHSFTRLDKNTFLITVGNLSTPEELRALRSLVDALHTEVKQAYLETGRLINGIIDISNLRSYKPEAIHIIADALRRNRPFVHRTATYGGSRFIRLAQEVVRALAGREDFKAFKTKEEALAWVRGNNTDA